MSAINERVSPKRLAEIIARAEVCDDSVLTDYRDIESMARELQQYRAAAEPVAWMVIDSDSGEKILRVDRSNIEGEAIPLYAAPQVTSVPDEIESISGSDYDDYYCDGWNACHAAMLNGGKS